MSPSAAAVADPVGSWAYVNAASRMAERYGTRVIQGLYEPDNRKGKDNGEGKCMNKGSGKGLHKCKGQGKGKINNTCLALVLGLEHMP